MAPVHALRYTLPRGVTGPAIAAALLAAVLGADATSPASAQDAPTPGEAFLTRFSGTTETGGQTLIDPNGISASLLDLSVTGSPPQGAVLQDVPQRLGVTAAQVGQVFGLAIDAEAPARFFLSATSAFGLHLAPGTSDWMPGMWGEGGGPGTIYILDPEQNYAPQVFADVTLGGRANSGAGLGNIAFDWRHRQLFVSDLETGMIHRLDADSADDLGHYDHGVDGRADFFDATGGAALSLAPVPFDPASTARLADCPSGDFARTPSCWNFADFRRRVWGIAVREDPITHQVRLFYAVWSSQGFGNPDFAAAAEDERKNSVWSVGIAPDGSFDSSDVRREFILPDFFRSPEAIARAGFSNPVADIAFGGLDQDVMLLAERGGVRNRGLGADEAFAFPHEARVLRYQYSPEGRWDAIGRYDVGYDDRQDAGPPYLRAGASGGVSFGPGFGPDGTVNPAWPNAFVWFSGDALCSPLAPCFDPATGDHTAAADVSGIQGQNELAYSALAPDEAFSPYPAPGPATPTGGPDQAYFIDADAAGTPPSNDATRIGDIEVYQPVGGDLLAGGPLPPPFPPGPPPFPPEPGWDPAPLPPGGWFPLPPLPYPTDLAIEKTGPASCQEGVDCLYSAKITNLGAVPYVGILAINDTMPAGATLSTASPGWNCVEAAPSVSCRTNAFAILGVGASATLNLAIRLPAVVPGPTVENCAAIDWFEMGTDDGPGDANDVSCVTTPVDDGFDLGLIKTGPANCIENANCIYGLVVKNWGPGDFAGTLAVKDTLPANVDFVSASGGWSCIQAGTDLTCEKGGMSLLSGALTIFSLTVKLPDGIAGGSIENCAEINWAAMTSDDGAADAHADDDCHTTNINPKAGFFDLGISKVGPGSCDPGDNCAYTITVRNEGPDDYMGPLSIRDFMPAPGATFVSASFGWICIGAMPNKICAPVGGPFTLHPGDELAVTLTFQLPNPFAPPSFLNCGFIRFGLGGMPPNDNPAPPAAEKSDAYCTITHVGDGADLVVEKLGPEECYEGHECEYTIRVTNAGPKNYIGTAAVTDTLPAGASVVSASDGWNCHEFAAGTTTCTKTVTPWAPGVIETFNLTVLLPDPVAGNDVENCAEIDWTDAFPGGPDPSYTGDDDATNDGPVCVTTPVLAADLAPFGGTVCNEDADCGLDVEIENRGGKLFRGSAGIRGTFAPAIQVKSVAALTPGLRCSPTNDGYECLGEDLEIEAGESARIKVVVFIPQGFPEDRVMHRKEMIWPNANDKDDREENDHHVSFITIAKEQEPLECSGGRAVNGACVCPGGIAPEQVGPNAYRCVPPTPTQPTPPPRPTPQCEGGRVQGNACVCPPGFDRQQIGTNSFRCIAPPPPPQLICEGGRVSRGDCLCPQDFRRQQIGPNAFRCIAPPPPPQLICDGGRVSRGNCLCPQGTNRIQTGPNAFRCVAPPPPELVCLGGQVSRGQCICPTGSERQQLGPNQFRCVVPPPRLTCDGGRVANGQCVCPNGTIRRQVGPNAFQCQRIQIQPLPPPGPSTTTPPTPICRGGQVQRGQCFCPTGTVRQQTGPNAFSCVKVEIQIPQLPNLRIIPPQQTVPR